MDSHLRTDEYANALVPMSPGQNNRFENLCDEVMLTIFKYIHHNDYLNLMIAFPNLQRLLQYEYLGHDITFDVFEQCREKEYEIFLRDSTKSISIQGFITFPVTPTISSIFLKQLSLKCPNIEYLSLVFQSFESQPLHYILALRKLKCLSIKHSVALEFPVEFDNDFNISTLNSSEIETIILKNCLWIENDHIKLICQLPKLKHLCLKGCTELAHCAYLKTMIYGRTFENLQTLDLRDTIMDDNNLIYIYTIRSLKHLHFRKIQGIEVMWDNITIRGINLLDNDYTLDAHYLADNTTKCKLFSLSVCNYKEIKDDSLMCMARHQSLQFLDVTGTGCTPNGIHIFKKKRPDVQIKFQH